MSLPLHRRDLLRGLAAASVIAAQPAWLDGAVSYLAGGTDDERRQWWRDARFGMFVHWGLYSILAGEWNGRTDYGEWIRNNAKIPIGEYDTLLARFNPTQFSADAFAKTAADAGAKYLVITSKHHDGFALFNSKAGPFNVMSTPFKRDIMKEIAAACRRHGVTPCWYHSIMDWHHPDYLPRRQWEAADRPPTGAVYQRFVDYLNRQIEELLTNYGDIGVMRATARDRSVFVFLPEWPADRNLLIPRFGGTPTRARMLGDRAWQNVQRVDAGTVVRLPERAADPVCSVLELETAR